MNEAESKESVSLNRVINRLVLPHNVKLLAREEEKKNEMDKNMFS